MKQLFILVCGVVLGWVGTTAFTNYQAGATSPGEMFKGIDKTKGGTVDPSLSPEAQLQERVSKLEQELKGSINREGELKETKEKAELLRKEAKDQLDKLEKEFADYKKEYRLSMQYRAKGMKLANFKSGLTQLENVEIIEVDGSALHIRHEGGSGKYEINTLEPELQRLLGY